MNFQFIAPNYLRKKYGITIAFCSFLYLVLFVVNYADNLPYWDQWELVPLIKKMNDGTLTFSDLWAQHNEHRILFPRIVMLVLAYFTNWNIYFELGINLIFLSISFFLIYNRISLCKLNSENHNILLSVVSVMVFSVIQVENFLWGWQLQIFMNVMMVISGVILLAHGKLSITRVGFAGVGTMIAVYSFANGLFFLPIGLFIILLRREFNLQQRWKYAAGWILYSSILVFGYLYQYHKPTSHPELEFIFNHPLVATQYFFAYLGAPMASFSSTIACMMGIVAISIFFYTIYISSILYRRKTSEFEFILPWIGLMSYSIISAMVTTIGRAGFGINQAMSYRYLTFTILLWVSAAIIFCTLSTIAELKISLPHRIRYIIVLTLCLLFVRSNMAAWKWAHSHIDMMQKARTQFNSDQIDEQFIKENVYPGDIAERMIYLKEHKLAGFSFDHNIISDRNYYRNIMEGK